MRFAFFVAVGATLLLAGCAGLGEPSSEGAYQPPATTGAPVAFIRGSMIPGDSVFDGDHIGSVLMIDMKFISVAHRSWQEPIALTPGRHDITVAYVQSNFRGQANLKFEAIAGVTYQVQIMIPVEPLEKQRYCDLWIVNLATSEIVSAIGHSRVSGGKTASVFAPQ